MSKIRSFRVGRVTVYLRSRTWYLRYCENTRRQQVRAGVDRDSSRRLAAQVNAQLESGAPAACSFEQISIPELRRRWLDHHEHVLRSSVTTISRYRSASEHLINFISNVQPVRYASQFREANAEAFVRHLRQLEVSPNGHPRAARRRLRDKGIKYVLEVSRTLFGFALKRRHLPPYSENPFTIIQIDRIPVEDAKPIIIFDVAQERQFLEACDDWQLPIFATLMLTGLRPGELTHLLLPEDVDLQEGWLAVRNKPDLGWQVKTRNERRVPLMPELKDVLAIVANERGSGPLFLRRDGANVSAYRFAHATREQLRAELDRRIARRQVAGDSPSRAQKRQMFQRLWFEMGAVFEDRLRIEFMKLTCSIGLPQLTAPKTLRHLFATNLQEVNIDPLIRNQLMGHVAAGEGRSSGPLGMTGIYSHASPATIRRQMTEAMQGRPAMDVLRRWLERRAAEGIVSA